MLCEKSLLPLSPRFIYFVQGIKIHYWRRFSMVPEAQLLQRQLLAEGLFLNYSSVTRYLRGASLSKHDLSTAAVSRYCLLTAETHKIYFKPVHLQNLSNFIVVWLITEGLWTQVKEDNRLFTAHWASCKFVVIKTIYRLSFSIFFYNIFINY